jgi:outer membrane receptor protein involved in Fe transport
MSVKQSDNVSYSVRTAVALILGSAAMMAAAQQVSAADDQGPPTASNASAAPAPLLEEVTVTGSRIRRRDLEASSPLVQVDAEQLEKRSGLNIESYLNQLPNYNPAAAPTTAANLDVQASAVNSVGIASISLRGFGPNRSLVLVDGHRTTPINALMVTDINSIPSSMIESVEIVSGGASAVYGADAIGGVTNFKMRKNFQGLELDYQDGITQAGDGNEMRASAVMGTKIGDGRGNITFATEYYDRRAAFAKNRDFFKKGWADPNEGTADLFLFGLNGYNNGFNFGPSNPTPNAVNAVFNTAARNTGGYNYFASPFVAGLFQGFRFNPDGTMYDPQGNNLATYKGGAITGGQFAYQNVYDSSQLNGPGPQGPPSVIQTVKYNDLGRYASSPQTRYSFMGTGTFDISDKVHFYSNARFAESLTQTFLIPTNASYGWEAQVPYNPTTDSPINPTAVTAATDAATAAQIVQAFGANPTSTNPLWNPGFIPTGAPNAQHPIPWQLAVLLNSRPAPAGPVSCNNSIAKTLCPSAGSTSSWIAETYPLSSFPQRSTTDISEVWQIETGFRFSLFSDWTGDVYYSRGQSLDYVNAFGDNSLQRWRAVIDAPDYGRNLTVQGNQNGASVGFGTSVPSTCTSGFYNTLFGGDAVPSANCQQAVEAQLQTMTKNQMDIVNAEFQGTLFRLPAGDLGALVGYEYRRNSAQFIPDGLQSTNSFLDQVIGVYPLGSLDAKTSVRDIYTELLAPIIADVPLIKKLELDLGGRYSNYDTAPNATTFKLNANWDVTSSVRFRGGFNRATRAPNLGELFLNTQEVFGFGPLFGDPCSLKSLAPFGAGGAAPDAQPNPGDAPTALAPGQTAAGAKSAYLICQAQMGLAGATQFYGGHQTVPNSGGFAWVNQQGNTNLQSETANTYTAGIVLSNLADSPWIRGFSASVDWWKVDIKNAIELSSIDYANFLCYGAVQVTDAAGAAAQAASTACQNVPRNMGNGNATTQQLQYNNQATISTSGVDLDLNWLIKLSDVGLHVPGAFAISSNDSWLNYYNTKASPLAFDVNTNWKGSLGPNLAGTNPGAYSYRLFTSFAYVLPSFSASLMWRYLPSVNSADHASQQAIIKNNQAVAGGAQGIILGYTPNTDLAAAHYNQIDLSFSWTINSILQLRAGIDNLFDAQPAIIGGNNNTGGGGRHAGFPTTLNVCSDQAKALGCQNPTTYSLASSGAGVTNGGYYDILGRRFFLGIKARF